jgi:hypothetical protein
VSSHSRVFWKQVFGKIDKLPTSKAVKGLGCICFLPQTDAADLSPVSQGNTKGQKEIRVPLSKERKERKYEQSKAAYRPYNPAFVDETRRRLCDVSKRVNCQSSSFIRHQTVYQFSVTCDSEC